MSDSANSMLERWSAPVVQGQLAKPRPAMSYDELQRKEQLTVQEHYARAREEGLQAARAEYEARIADVKDRVAKLDSICNVLSRPLGELDAEVERQLVALALAVAKHLVRRELRVDPTQVIAIIRETVALLPSAARDVRVFLHPDDAALVREKLATPQMERAWTVVEDPVMSRGGCRVTTDTSLVDARLETRLGEVISQVLGSERSEQRIELDGSGE